MWNASKKLRPLILIGLCVLCPMGCATHSETVRTEYITPPPSLLTPCEKPSPGDLRTNGDLARYASAMRYALETCAAKIDALTVFFTVDSGPENR